MTSENQASINFRYSKFTFIAMLAMETFRINASIYWIPIVAIPGIHFSFDFYVILQHLRFSFARQPSPPPLRPPLQSDQLNIKESILSLLVRREKLFNFFFFFPPVKNFGPKFVRQDGKTFRFVPSSRNK